MTLIDLFPLFLNFSDKGYYLHRQSNNKSSCYCQNKWIRHDY